MCGGYSHARNRADGCLSPGRLRPGRRSRCLGGTQPRGRPCAPGLSSGLGGPGSDWWCSMTAASRRARCGATRQLIARGCRIVLGPYGSDCVRAVARECAGAVVWNHGGAADDVQRLPGVVSVSAPSSRYLVALGRAVAGLRPGARVAVLTAPGRFARFASEGLEGEASALGLELVGTWAGRMPSSSAARSSGKRSGYAGSPAETTSCSAASRPASPPAPWGQDMAGGDARARAAAPDPPGEPALGPGSVPLATTSALRRTRPRLVAQHRLQLDPADPLAAARTLRTSTFFGAFELDATAFSAATASRSSAVGPASPNSSWPRPRDRLASRRDRRRGRRRRRIAVRRARAWPARTSRRRPRAPP